MKADGTEEVSGFFLHPWSTSPCCCSIYWLIPSLGAAELIEPQLSCEIVQVCIRINGLKSMCAFVSPHKPPMNVLSLGLVCPSASAAAAVRTWAHTALAHVNVWLSMQLVEWSTWIRMSRSRTFRLSLNWWWNRCNVSDTEIFFIQRRWKKRYVMLAKSLCHMETQPYLYQHPIRQHRRKYEECKMLKA